MGQPAQLQYISVGGNRHPAAADWTEHNCGIVAFGASNHVALWNPLVRSFRDMSYMAYSIDSRKGLKSSRRI